MVGVARTTFKGKEKEGRMLKMSKP